MISVSIETAEQTDARLRAVTTRARLKVYGGTYAFLEFPLADFPHAVRPDALALVRDDRVWSQLVPCDDASEELFLIFRLHFPTAASEDNSGFVGWLASLLKRRFGTGVFVTCGQNRAEGGIFDYWGVPHRLGPQVIAEIRALVAGRAPA